MSEHKTGKSNWTDDQKRAYWSRRQNGERGQGFYFTKRGFSYKNAHTASISKNTVTKKAWRKMTKRARNAIAYMSKSGAGS